MSDTAPPYIADAVHDARGRPKGRYHTEQIVAHWTVVFLVLFQYATGGAMDAAYRATVDFGRLPADGVIFVHGLIGTSIWIVMLWRLSMRFRYGAPPPPDSLSRPLQIVSRSVHYAFYAVLLGMPVFGMLALWIKSGIIGTLHGWAAYLLLALAVAHVAGATLHMVKGDGVIRRILRGNTMP